MDISSPLNLEAANLYEKDIDQFKERAKSCVLDWKEQLYLVKDHPDPHYLRFSSYQEQVHGPFRDRMKAGASVEDEEKEDEVGAEGRKKSYVASGSLTIFSENILPPAEGPKSMPK